MRHDEDVKIVRIIPIPRHETANGASSSSNTYGSSSNVKGIVDTLGYRRLRIEVTKNTGTAAKVTVRTAFQSAPSTLFVSATPLSGTTSGIWVNGVTASAATYLLDIDLSAYSGRKRYVNCKLTTCTTCGYTAVNGYLTNAEQFPPSTTGYTATTRYA